MTASSSREWIVGDCDDKLIVIPENEAQRLACLYDALCECVTWGELKRAVIRERGLYEEILARAWLDAPGENEPFSRDQIPGCYEGDWPEIPAERMSEWLPGSIQQLGTPVVTLFGPDLLTIPPACRSVVLARLRRLGMPHREDDSLVYRACGAWRYG